MDDDDDIASLLQKARKYRELGNAVHDRHTRLALLELAFEFEERAKRQTDAAKGTAAVHEAESGYSAAGKRSSSSL